MKKRGRLKARGSPPETAITGGVQPWRSPWLLATLMVMVTVAILAFTFPETGDGPDDGPGDGPDDPGDGGPGRVYHDVGIPLSDVGTEARWYTYESGTSQVRFFTVADGRGEVHVGLDACDVCYAANLGFHQNASKMQCNSCGKEFSIKGIGSDNAPGSCWPSFVPYEISEGYMLIDTEFLDTRTYMFE